MPEAKRRIIDMSESKNITDAIVEWYSTDEYHSTDIIMDTPLKQKIKKWNSRKFPNQIRCICGKTDFIGDFNLMSNVFTNERCIIGPCCSKQLSEREIYKKYLTI